MELNKNHRLKLISELDSVRIDMEIIEGFIDEKTKRITQEINSHNKENPQDQKTIEKHSDFWLVDWWNVELFILKNTLNTIRELLADNQIDL
jgi:molybdopterin-guanine dinucleotide biosynthesis protein